MAARFPGGADSRRYVVAGPTSPPHENPWMSRATTRMMGAARPICVVSRGQRHDGRRRRHHQQRQGHGRAPALAVGIGADHRGTERPGEEADAEGRERRQQPRDLRLAGEEGAPDHHREERKDQEIVELEPVADDHGNHALARESGRGGVMAQLGPIITRNAGRRPTVRTARAPSRPSSADTPSSVRDDAPSG